MSASPSEDILGFKFALCDVDVDVSLDKGLGHIFYLEIGNQTDRDATFEVAESIYVTKDKEQLERGGFYLGYSLSGIVKAGARRKAGIIFFKNRLPKIRAGDQLFIDVVLSDRPKISLRFGYRPREEGWLLLERNVEEVDTKPTPKELSELLTEGIERLDVLEERLGVSLENLYVAVDNDYSSIRITGELHASSGTALSHDLEVVAAMYDENGRLVKTTSRSFLEKIFFGFDVVNLSTYEAGLALRVRKIRVFPKAS